MTKKLINLPSNKQIEADRAMSGSGRKTNYRKGVTSKVLYDAPEPKENEQVVKVVGLRGSNLFEVQDEHGATSVTMLPTKFRKLIWVKRGTFVYIYATV